MIDIIGGGTFSHVRSHLALAAPAFGSTARGLAGLYTQLEKREVHGKPGMALVKHARLHLTKMADHESDIVTNDDVAALVDRLVADPATRVIYMNAALCDYTGEMVGQGVEAWKPRIPSGKYAKRLQTSTGPQLMEITPAEKLLARIRRERKDIFLVAFKTTTGASSDEQYLAALNLLKANSCNLVLANDTVTRNNMVVAPEETRYYETTDRYEAIKGLKAMVDARSTNTFTRSTVVEDGGLISWNADVVPANLRAVVNWLVAAGAYKPFRGATAGHFAVRVSPECCLTSRRKTDYTAPGGLDLVMVEYEGFDRVLAYGAKPSVGGQSQRIVFQEHEGLDCIVHAHIPLRADAPDAVPVAAQEPYECGSHQCGQNTSRNLADVEGGIHAVMLDNHGPNIVFSKDTPAERVIAFIQRNFDVSAKTGGLVEQQLEVA